MGEQLVVAAFESTPIQYHDLSYAKWCDASGDVGSFY